MKYKVMIVEDQTMPRELFELRIQASEHFETALSIDNAALADVYCLRLPVDLILMDVVTRNGENRTAAEWMRLLTQTVDLMDSRYHRMQTERWMAIRFR